MVIHIELTNYNYNNYTNSNGLPVNLAQSKKKRNFNNNNNNNNNNNITSTKKYILPERRNNKQNNNYNDKNYDNNNGGKKNEINNKSLKCEKDIQWIINIQNVHNSVNENSETDEKMHLILRGSSLTKSWHTNILYKLTNSRNILLLAVLLTSFFSFTRVSGQVCGHPRVPLNAKVKIISDNLGTTEAKYECDPGYELFGPDTIKCKSPKGWDTEIPFCSTNVAYMKPVNQSSYTRQGLATYANDGKPGNQDPDRHECSETQKEPSPWWRVDLLVPQTIRAVRIKTRGCCGQQPLQDLEIRVGNSSIDLQRNPLCAWYPGTLDEGVTKTFSCARPLIGQYVVIQLVGVEGSLSLCEVEVFSNNEFSTERCINSNFNSDTFLASFSGMCYEFHVTRGESFIKAQEICKSHGGDLIHNISNLANEYVFSQLERRKTELKTQLVWIGAQKEPGITSQKWKWINGDAVLKPAWGKDQPNNYNGEQNCVVLDGGRNWLWNDVGCNLDYLHFICQHSPLSCGSPDSFENTTVTGRNFTVGNEIVYSCPNGHALIGENKRFCTDIGTWSGLAPTCKYIDCGQLPSLEHGTIIMSENRTSFGVQATYLCHENYTLIGNENRTCEFNGWSGSQPECLVDWCKEPPEIPGGKFQVTNNRAGSTAQYECNLGYVMIGEPFISCGLGGEWSSKPPTCRFIDCGAPVRPDRGSITLINNSTTVNSKVKYRCEDDHWLVGPEELTCTKDGKWSDDAPICELITCDTPHVPPGSYVVGYDYNVHSFIQYHCDPGHVLRGSSNLECLDTGEWSGDAPFCEYVDCGALTPIPHGSHKYLQNTTYIGSEVVFSCSTSHKLNGVAKRICLETGLWSDVSPKCEEIRCLEPVLATHSILSVTGNDRMYGRTLIRTADVAPTNAQTYKIGALAKYRCERGYKIVGDPLVTCGDTGLWSGQVPECVYVECGQPTTIENGKVILATNATYYGAAALYECNKNFKLDGVSRRLCLEDGSWSHEAPSCKELTCDIPNLHENVIVDSGPRIVGALAKFSCPKGRYLVGNDTVKCLQSGHWTGKSPICKDIDCGRPLPIENGRVIIVNESTIYGGSAEYHCIPNFNRIGQYLRKCLEDGKWSGEEPRCELIANETQESSGLETGIAVSATIIIILLILIGLIFLHRNKARPVKNTENVQAAESKEDRNAAVMSYSTLDASNRAQMDISNPATFNTFQQQQQRNTNNNKNNSIRSTENIYDQIPAEQYYDAPYEMRMNEEVYEPEPGVGNVITINGISVR